MITKRGTISAKDEWKQVKATLDRLKFYYNLTDVDIIDFPADIQRTIEYCNFIELKPRLVIGYPSEDIQIEKLEKCISFGLKDLFYTFTILDEAFYFFLCEKNLNLTINCRITKENYKVLPKLAEYFAKLKPKMVYFSFFNPEEEIYFEINYSKVTPHLERAMNFLCENKIKFLVRNIPFCFMVGSEQYVSNFNQWQYDDGWDYKALWNLDKEKLKPIIDNAKNSGVYGEDDEQLLHNFCSREQCKSNVRLNRCKQCINRYICDGIYPEYIKKFGAEEIKEVWGYLFYRNPLHYRK